MGVHIVYWDFPILPTWPCLELNSLPSSVEGEMNIEIYYL